MEILLTILGGIFLIYVCTRARQQRTQITRNCPKCGTTCHANPNSTGIRVAGGDYLHDFECPHCGHKFRV